MKSPLLRMRDFSFCLRGIIKFPLGVGYWSSWYPFPVYAKSQKSPDQEHFLKWEIRVVVCWQLRLEWSAPQEMYVNADQICLPHRFPLSTWNPPRWPSFPFMGSRTRRCSLCYKTHMGTRHSQISPNLPKAFPSVHHPSSLQNMCSKLSHFDSIASKVVVVGLK